MPHFIKHRSYYFTMCIIALVVAFSVYPPFQSNAQTTKPKENSKQQESPSRKFAAPGKSDATYEEVKIEMQRAMQEVEQAMQRLNKEDIPRMREEIQKALKSMNAQEMRREMETAMKEVDMSAIQQEISAAMKELQNEKLSSEVARALKEVNFEKMQAELKEMQLVNMAEVERSMKKVQEELERTNLNMEGILEKAKKEMGAARQQLKLISEGIDELEKDGLIKKTDTINIEWEKETLILNGVKQSKSVSEKYRKYFGNGQFKFNNDPNRGTK
jgi:hypothetical protein